MSAATESTQTQTQQCVANGSSGNTEPSTEISATSSVSSSSPVPQSMNGTAIDLAPASASAAAPPSSAGKPSTHEAKRFLLKHKEKLKMNQYWYSVPTIAAMVDECERESKRAAFLSTPSIFFSLNDKALQANSKVFDYDEMWAKHPGFVKYDYKKPEEIPKDLHHTFDFIVIDPPFITAEVWAEYAKAANMLLIKGTEEIEIDSKLADEYNAALCRSHAAGLASLNGEVSGTSFAGNIASMLSSVFNMGSSSSSSPTPSTLPTPIPPRPSPSDPSRSIVTVPRGKLLLSTIPEHLGYLYVLLGCYQPKFRPSIPNLIYQYSLYVNYPSSALMRLNPEIDDDESMSPDDFTARKKPTINF